MKSNSKIVREEKTSKNLTFKEITLSIITGIITGFINGLFGGGGGMVVVPMLSLLLKYKSKNAHATAILIILPLSIISSIFYISFGNLNFDTLIPVGIGVVAGGILGALTLSKLPSKWVGIIFSIAMVAAGVKMLFF